MLDRLDKLGLPPDSQQGPATADAQQLRTDLQTRLRDIQADAAAVARGNLAAIGRLVTDLSRDKSVAPHISNELRHLLTIDLGISLAETHACRELVGIPICRGAGPGKHRSSARRAAWRPRSGRKL